MDSRFLQAHKEAWWAFGLAIAYLTAWAVTAWLPDKQLGLTGMPVWFELSCFLVPLLFVVLCWLMIRVVFRDIPLEDENDTTN